MDNEKGKQMELTEIMSTIIAGIIAIIGIIGLLYLWNNYGKKELEQRNKVIEIKERQTIALEKIADYYSNLHI